MKGLYWFMGACVLILAIDIGQAKWMEWRKRRTQIQQPETSEE